MHDYPGYSLDASQSDYFTFHQFVYFIINNNNKYSYEKYINAKLGISTLVSDTDNSLHNNSLHRQLVTPTTAYTDNWLHQQLVTPTTGYSDNWLHRQLVTARRQLDTATTGYSDNSLHDNPSRFDWLIPVFFYSNF